jgi:hypothetical protein
VIMSARRKQTAVQALANAAYSLPRNALPVPFAPSEVAISHERLNKQRTEIIKLMEELRDLRFQELFVYLETFSENLASADIFDLFPFQPPIRPSSLNLTINDENIAYIEQWTSKFRAPKLDVNRAIFVDGNVEPLERLEMILEQERILTEIFEKAIEDLKSIELPASGGATMYMSFKGRRYKVRTNPKDKRKRFILTSDGQVSLAEAKKLQKQYLKEKAANKAYRKSTHR